MSGARNRRYARSLTSSGDLLFTVSPAVSAAGAPPGERSANQVGGPTERKGLGDAIQFPINPKTASNT